MSRKRFGRDPISERFAIKEGLDEMHTEENPSKKKEGLFSEVELDENALEIIKGEKEIQDFPEKSHKELSERVVGDI